MKKHIKLITNIFLNSIALSIIIGSFLKIVGPINQSNKINRKIDITMKSNSSIRKDSRTSSSNLLL